MKPVVIHWFRKGLRLHDNSALLEAVKEVCNETKLKYYSPLFLINGFA